ncbi:MAG TPA: tRNA threonylcarbamoyladenosine dehydratase [Bacteroidales bacterium]|nr:tRNA threonylcarbamoyladenosine dehydratase [Bacteroidales bacterium]
MGNWLERTELLLGEQGLERLRDRHVLIVGLGGVGAFAAEAICRSGVGRLTIADGDVIQPSNINRQLIALHSTVGMRKAEVVGKRLMDINPSLQLRVIDEYLRDERLKELVAEPYDFVVDAIDTLSPKVFLIMDAVRSGHRIVSSMGAGGKMDPSKIQVADISKSHSCRLAYMVRKRLHRQGIRSGINVVFSPEEVDRESILYTPGETNKLTTVGTISYMPALFGLTVASVVIRQLIEPLDDSRNHLNE